MNNKIKSDMSRCTRDWCLRSLRTTFVGKFVGYIHINNDIHYDMCEYYYGIVPVCII